MITAYIDESGNLTDNNPFFITAVVCLRDERIPSRIIKRLRRVLGKRKGKVGKEIKFNNSSIRVKNYFIKRFLDEDLYCLVLVIDKEKKRIADSPENYAKVLIRVLNIGTKIYNWEKIIIDRKFDKLIDQQRLDKEIVLSGVTIREIKFVDSEVSDGVKLADFVAGFYGQFYNLNKPLPKELSGNASEERLSWSLLTQKTVVPKGPDASIESKTS